jgi:hypothetical protein
MEIFLIMKATKNFLVKMMGLTLIILLCQSLLMTVIAQQNGSVNIRPVMKISNQLKPNDNPMHLTNLNVDIKVVGQVAVTTLDMTFYNSNSRVMEGEFVFPLGEGQTVSRFALDINGNLREGVVVEKEKGRKTFEAIARKGVDPGLLEMAGGNTFKARVYPLPARGSRRVVIAFEQELTDKGNYDLYTLPLNIDEPVDKFSVHAEVVKNRVRLDQGNELGNLSFKEWNDSYVADMEQVNFTPDKQIALDLPHIDNDLRIFTAAMSSAPDSSTFYMSLRPDLFKEEKPLPKKITLLWDNSGSAGTRDITRELVLLGNYIGRLGNVTIDLVTFNIKTEKPQSFTITGGNWENLRTALNAIVNDGATSFGSIDFSLLKTDEILLFSDGMTDFGPSSPVFSGVPVNTINSGLTADHSFLSYIAQRSGGVYINLTEQSAEEATNLLCSSNYHFISAKVISGNVREVFPSMPCQFENTFTLAGKMTGETATIKLDFGFGSRVVYSKEVKINADNSADAQLLRRLWAEKKISELSVNASGNEEEITKTGKKYGIVTPNTSLIVLENLSDYLQYDIFPPLELRGEFLKEKKALKDQIETNKKSHLDRVVSMSNDQSTWWATSYPVGKPEKSGKQVEDSVRVLGYAVEMVESVSDDAVSVEMNEMPASAPDRAFEASPAENKDKDEKIKADIQINAWDPETPYLKVLQYASKGDEYKTYLKLKKEYGSTPAFYIDASDFFFKLGENEKALRIISNLAELQLESPQLLRILGKKLVEMKNYNYATSVFEKVIKIRAEEPQSFIDLGLSYAAAGNPQKAVKTLYEVVNREWDMRFPCVELIALNEINGIIDRNPAINYSFIDKRLIKKEPVDIRVVLTWDTDNTDMDLWVTDPDGEKCFYQNKLTRLGGKISDDFTGGYGPEEFMIRKAVHGTYNVQVNYYGTGSQAVLAPVNLHLTFITNFGRPDQKSQQVTIRLDNQKDVIDVGKFTF